MKVSGKRIAYIGAALTAAAVVVFGVRVWFRAQADAAGARGMSHHADLRYDEALTEYRRAEELDPGNWHWPYYRALIHLDRGEALEGAGALRHVASMQPGLGIVWWRLGEAEFKQARYDEADAAFSRAEADATVAVHARQGRDRVGYARGNTASQQTYTPPRDPMVDALARISRSSMFLLKLAASPAAARDPAFREELTRRALEVDPENPDVVYEMGSLIQQRGGAQEALPYFMRHLDMVDDDQQTLVQIGKCYIDLGRLDEAERTLRQALALADDAIGFYNLGIVLEQRDRMQEAEQSYRRTLELNAGLARAHNNLGGLLAASGRVDEAEQHLRESIRLDPALPDAYVSLAALQLERGRPSEAAASARQALAIDARHVDAHVNLGVALAQLGDFTQARREFDEALRIDPRHRNARRNRDALR
jgi:tetratricopeptide (TPR) repeat protein